MGKSLFISGNTHPKLNSQTPPLRIIIMGIFIVMHYILYTK